ncbi:hypothetical protein [Halorubrum tropicale]|uniref:hypothetical protein n=1 Tax=Halorubrum tropicale TaxID=1765655 RepID=UPI000A693B0B|nr:hypothetical protein [Halorubrum tropicale]
MRNEPVGVRRLDRAPVMTPDREPPGESHWCEAVGSRVYALKSECPHGCAGRR